MRTRLLPTTVMRSVLSAFAGDRRGVILPYATVMLGVIVGFGVLALDGGRIRSLQTQLQAGADALALAGAAELNRAPGARARATAAINSLVQNGVAGLGGGSVAVSSIVFYRTLPAASTSFTSGTVAADDGHARFVAVTLAPVTLPTILPASFVSAGSGNTISTGAAAVAGFDQVACQFTPMFICNPFETSGMTYDQATAALINSTPNRLVALQGAGNAQYAPGNFGWISPPVNNTTNLCGSGNTVVQAAAQTSPATCFRNTAINTQPGNIAASDEGLNTRFDLYNGSFQNCRGNANYAPAPNVRKGFTPSGGNGGGNGNGNANGNGNGNANGNNNAACNPSQPSPYPNGTNAGTSGAAGFPLDSNMTSPSVALGNGTWNCLGYWTIAHPTGTAGAGKAPAGCTSAATAIGRYGVYMYEINNGFVNDASSNGERGTPACYNGTASAATNPNRRVLNVAVLNCLNLANEGYSLNGQASNLPVAALANFFLTLPVTSSQGPIYGEYIGIAQPGDPKSGSLYYQVQLYR
ncbi:pilus assembly protein TadG-related protein [uncultured Alsobacter sp.]|uniref:pilus assembly protein TadG-related protein n=1 Tax=uncultured Alsobacter sp. TaxID=1748258 RepID=UPI0025D3394E|nr:pilus assembly protein TadG-related protein [uncultured Alsobacter sp.]